jgi:hypothetical protein
VGEGVDPAALGALIVVLALAAAVAVALVVAQGRRRKRRRARIYVGASARDAHVGDVIPVGRRGKQLRIAEVDAAAGVVSVEPAPPPPPAAKRGATAHEQALLRALGFDPKTHDLQPVLQPWKGVQITKDGERVRFFTEKQVRQRQPAFDRALREARA